MSATESSTKLLLGRYEILFSIGSGGMAEVFLAEDKKENRKVAVKFPQFGNNEKLARTRFMREAKAISKLNHPNIAKLYDVSDDEESPFFVMEFIDGETLTDKIYKGELPLGQSVQFIIQAAKGLEAAHRGGFIHRDLKPSNVMITKDGIVKVLDFGLAKQITHDDSGEITNDFFTGTQAKTLSGVIVGTPMYLSPEQATALPVDERSDIFSLGVLLYECITGRPAFSGNSVMEIAAKVLRDDPINPSKINPHINAELERVTLKALSKQPEDRFQSAAEFLEALSKIDLAKEADTISPSFLTRTLDYRRLITRTITDGVKKPRFSFGNIVAISLLLIALSFLSYWFFIRTKEYQPNPEAKKKYDEGVALIQESAFHTATQKLSEAITLDPNYALAHARLAEAWFELDYADQSLRRILDYQSLINNGINLNKTDRLYGDAVSASVRQEFGQAVRNYEELAKLYPSDATVLSDLARAYDRNGEFEKALKQYREAINHNPKYANAYLRIGELYSRRKDIASAKNVFDEAERLYREQNNDEGLAETLFERGRFYNLLDMSQEATEYLDKALELSISKKFTHQQVEILLQKTSVAYTIGEYDKAKQLANESIELARKNGFDSLEITGFLELATTYSNLGDVPEAKKWFEETLKSAERLNIPFVKARALTALANIYMGRGQLDEAQSTLSQAQAIFEKQSLSKGSFISLFIISQLKDVQGEFNKSLEILNASFSKVEELGDWGLIADYRYQLAITYQHLENYPQALQHAKESQRLLIQLNSSSSLAYTLVTLGDIYLQMGDLDNAELSFGEGLKLTQQSKSPDSYVLTLIYVGLGRLELSRESYSKAIQASSKALIYAKDDVSDAKVSALYTLAKAQALAGEKQKSLATSRQAVDIAEKLKYPFYYNHALYSLALANYVNGKYQDAIDNALKAQNGFEKLNRQSEQFKVFWLLAMSSEKLGDKANATNYANKANDILIRLKQKFGELNYSSYINRADIQTINKQIQTLKQQS